MYLLVFLLPVPCTKEMVAAMNNDSIIFAMANPDPEIMPDVAKEAGAKVVGTGRSDFPNQVNNVLAFPWNLPWCPRCAGHTYKRRNESGCC